MNIPARTPSLSLGRSRLALVLVCAGFSGPASAASLLVDNFSGNTNGAETDVFVSQTADNTTPVTTMMTNLGSSNAIGDRTISVFGLGGSSNVTGSTLMLTANAGDDLNFFNNPSGGATAQTRHQAIWTVAAGNEDVFATVGVTSPLDLRVELDIGDDTNFQTLPSQAFLFTLRDGSDVTASYRGVVLSSDPLPSTNAEPSFRLVLEPSVLLSGFDGNDVRSMTLDAILNGDTAPTSFELDEIRITAVPEPTPLLFAAFGSLLFLAWRSRRAC